MNRFLKGIIVGIGGVAPGLSGSVLLIIFGLYQKCLDALGTLFTNFRKNLRFLIPLVAGMLLGVLLFSKVIDYFLTRHEMLTRYCFLGLIIGTLPTVFREVKKEGFHGWCWIVIAASFALGTWLFTFNGEAFPQITDPTLLQSILLGVAVAGTAIIPGVDPAVLLSTLGFYKMYVSALANFDLTILLPMIIGVAGGAVVISFGMSQLFRRAYTLTYSIIFGIFLSMIPHMLNESCVLHWDLTTAGAILLTILGFFVSFLLGDAQKHLERLQKYKNKEKD